MTISPPNLITQKQFERGVSKWLRVLSKPDYDTLEYSFATDAGKLTRVTFPIRSIKYLLSTVGASHIEARFLLLQDEIDQRRHYFTLVLYAIDATGARISAYYLADKTALHGIVDSAIAPQEHDEQKPLPSDSPTYYPDAYRVARDLAEDWRRYWRCSPSITPDLFANTYGPLQGYTFSLGDFMQNLFAEQSSPDSVLRVDFGLHRYYNIDTALQQTFGLILQLDVVSDSSSSEAAASDEQPFYDLSVPCPPGS